MARKPTISPSKISTYLACPVKYRWTYVDDRGQWYVKARSYYSFGLTLHRVLERFHDANETGVETIGEVLAAYDEGWISAGFTSAEEMAEVYGEGKQILERHVEQSRVEITAKTLFVERQLRMDMGSFNLVGRLDRVDEHEDGTLEILDYKSGRQSISEEEVASDLAMSCYHLLLRQLYPDRRIITSIVALVSGDKASHAMTAELLKELDADIRFIGNRMLAHDYEFLAPVAKPLCRSCDFVALCRRHEDFEETVHATEPAPYMT